MNNGNRRWGKSRRCEFKFDQYTLDCIDKIMGLGFNNRKDAVVYAIQSTVERIQLEEDVKKGRKVKA
jgi:hypothetical protein